MSSSLDLSLQFPFLQFPYQNIHNQGELPASSSSISPTNQFHLQHQHHRTYHKQGRLRHHACKYHFPNTSVHLLLKSSAEKKWKIFMIFHSEKRHSHKGAPSINHHPFGSRENGGRLVGKEWERAEVAEVSVILKKHVSLFCLEVKIVKTDVFFAFLLEHSGTSIISEVTNIKFHLPCSPKIYQFCIWVFEIAWRISII